MGLVEVRFINGSFQYFRFNPCYSGNGFGRDELGLILNLRLY